jgi:DNA topoisomerase-1
MKTLVIVESPTKAKTLGPILGAGYTVRASMGHVRDLPEHDLGVAIDEDFKPTYAIMRQKSKTIKALREALANADILCLATDPDREGEAIAWHLLQVLKPRNMKVQRVTFHEITPDAITKAFSQSDGHIDMNLVDAQQARRVLDRLVGYQVSPLLWKTKLGKSAGRVQSVALRLVVDREREIRAFVPQEYWSIHADLAKPEHHAQHFVARLVQIGNRKVGLDQSIMPKTRTEADQIVAALTGAQYQVKSVKQEKKQRKPWPPFTTSTLQQSASARLGMSPADAMKIAQELYEGIDIGDGKAVGLITYMRTDSTAISAEAQKAAREMVTQTLGAKYLPANAPTYATKVKNAQEAHEAIRPTDSFRYPNVIKPHLSERQFKVYDLIWRRFVASQMAPAIYDSTTVDVIATPVAANLPPALLELGTQNAPPAFLFRATGRELVFDGFLRVWQESEDKPDDGEEPQKLPSLRADDWLDLLELLTRQHFTQPPSRYTEAALIKALEDRGIGRPSTYAAIMATLKARAVVVLEKRFLRPTAQGEAVCDGLVAAFPQVMDYGFTAQVEDWLDDVSRGDISWVKVLHDFYTPFAQALGEAEAKLRSVPHPTAESVAASQQDAGETTSHSAGKSSKPRRSRGTAGKRTRTTKKLKPAPVLTSVICPICGAAMIQRTGPHGSFLGCSTYPKCKGTRKIDVLETTASSGNL